MWHVTFFFLVNLPKCGTVHKRLSMRAHEGTEYTTKGVKSSLVCSYRVSCLLSSLQCLFADTGKQQLYELGPKKTKWQLNKKGIGTKKERKLHTSARGRSTSILFALLKNSVYGATINIFIINIITVIFFIPPPVDIKKPQPCLFWANGALCSFWGLKQFSRSHSTVKYSVKTFFSQWWSHSGWLD